MQPRDQRRDVAQVVAVGVPSDAGDEDFEARTLPTVSGSRNIAPRGVLILEGTA
ncbi:MAG TPA: hypothetical protein VHZ54_07820 [Solirubrobacterales bacterium]|jgi:hypothetical protein|nr:hypothetical protein [Solirubrobacterales bacterium]